MIGSTFDIEFPEGRLPPIYNAVEVKSEHKGVTINLVGEVQQHLGGGRVRAIALGSDRGHDARHGRCRHRQTGFGSRRNGNAWPRVQRSRTRNRRTWDQSRPTSTCQFTAKLRKSTNLSTNTEVFETGIKVVDLLTPFVRGGKAGLFGGAGLGKTVILDRVDRSYRECPRWLLGFRRRRRADT